jgi:hypothetical protein
MGYKKREIDLGLEEDLEFRRIEKEFEGGVKETIEKVIIGGGTSTGTFTQKKVLLTMNGGENSIFIEPYVSDSVELYLNGQLMIKGDFYEETNPSSGLIGLLDEVINGDKIFVKYMKR